MKNEKGFTLIELVMVIVILGILAAVAIPKFIDLSASAKDGALKGVAGSMSSAMAVNYAARSISTGNGSQVANCTDVNAILMGGTPANYTVTAAGITAGTSATCTVAPNAGYIGTLGSMTFVGIGIS